MPKESCRRSFGHRTCALGAGPDLKERRERRPRADSMESSDLFDVVGQSAVTDVGASEDPQDFGVGFLDQAVLPGGSVL